MSSSSVYGRRSRQIVDETSPMAPFADRYPVTKAEADRVVRQMIAEDGLPGVVIRPDQIFGPGDHLHFGSIATRLRKGTAVIVGRGHNALPLVYVDDVVQGLLLALDDDDRAIGEVFNITNDAPLTQQEFMKAIAHHTGARPPRIHVPYRGLYAAAYAAERVAATSGASHRPLLTRLGVAFLGTDQRYSITKARRVLGYTPRVALDEGVRLTADWLSREVGGPATISTVSQRLPLGNARRMGRWAR
jgi:nucleoside-diphosphate-sugar epimerase